MRKRGEWQELRTPIWLLIAENTRRIGACSVLAHRVSDQRISTVVQGSGSGGPARTIAGIAMRAHAAVRVLVAYS
jgi:hypothetical protein